MKTQPTFFIKKYGDSGHKKLIFMPYCRVKHIEEEHNAILEECANVRPSRARIVNEKKLKSNIQRAKSKVRELVLCNKFEYFVTLTLSPEKVDRRDLKRAIVKLNRIISDMNTREEKAREERVTYVLIPERHKNGAWHFHGFIHGLTGEDLRKNVNGYDEWKQYADKMGYTNLTPLRDKTRAASYCLKYITKDLARSVEKRGAHLYYASKGLARATVEYRGTGVYDGQWDYEQEDGFSYVADYDKTEVRENFYTMPDVLVFNNRPWWKNAEKGFFTSYLIKGAIEYEKIYSYDPCISTCGGYSDRYTIARARGRYSNFGRVLGMVERDNVQFVWYISRP